MFVDPADNSMTAGSHTLRALDARHRFALATITCLMFIEGFDLVALALVARDVGKVFQASPTLLGFALSSAQLGSILGAAVAGGLSERFGPIALLLTVTSILAAGAVVCAVAPDMFWLVVGRILTGIGLGAAIPLTVSYLSANFAPEVSGTVIATALVGIGLGQIVAGFIAPPLVAMWGWRSVFVVATVATIALVPGFFALPIRKERPSSSEAQQGRLGPLLKSGWAKHLTLLLPIALCGAMIIYFLYSWMPFLSDRMGLSASASAASASLLAAGGLCGVMLIGMLLDRGIPPYALLATTYGMAAVLLGVIALAPLSPTSFLIICFLLGAAMVGSYNSVTMLIGKVFPQSAHVHVIAMGTLLSRASGFAAPVLTGVLISVGYGGQSLFLIAAILGSCVAACLALSSALPLPGQSKAQNTTMMAPGRAEEM